ncbi:MAG: glucosyltransferase domain-containing protein [Treponema sp.]|jgi:hypothetical protein|nr:glucosyltransferase domain-containing protein [Treponema sp.]
MKELTMNSKENRKKRLKLEGSVRYCICIISVLGIGCSITVLFPQVQRMIIRLAEQYLIQRKVNFYDDWMHTLSAWARGCIFLIIAFDFFTIIAAGRALFTQIVYEIKTCVSKVPRKPLLKSFLLMSGMYLTGYMSIIRANFSYADDLARAIEGYHGWNSWSRHLSDILATFIHVDTNLTDISPLPQIIALLIIALSSVLLVYILCDGKISVITLIAAIPVGLSPYFLENMSYKFDAPYMSLSVLFTIYPFLCAGSLRAFVFSSVVSLLAMCMTYQASSGIYVMITIVLVFKYWNNKQKTNRENLVFTGSAVLSFCCAMILFRFFFMVSGTTGHNVSTKIFPVKQLVSGMLINVQKYILYINDDFGSVWKILIAVIVVLFVIEVGRTSMLKKMPAIIIALLVIITAFIMSYGVYIILENPLYAPRALFGFGIFIAIIGVYVISRHTKIAIISVIALSFSFFVFAFSYGNALADQKRYTDFRMEMLLHDLSILFPDRNGSEMALRLENNMGFSPVVKNIAKHYPLIERLVPYRGYYPLDYYLRNYFHWGNDGTWESNVVAADLPRALDSYYHTIKSDGKHIFVMFKH